MKNYAVLGVCISIMSIALSSIYIAQCYGIQDNLGFWITHWGFWILDYPLRVLDSGIHTGGFGFWITHWGSWILNYTLGVLDSGLHTGGFGFWIPGIVSMAH